MTQSWLIDRRHALRGLGSIIALPLLNCMRPGWAGETKPPPRRSAFVYIPNGVNTLDYQITTPGDGYMFSRSLKPLEDDSLDGASGSYGDLNLRPVTDYRNARR